MTTTEIKTIFKNYLVLLECHNEQKRHISDYFKSKGIRTLEYPFFTADYSFMIMPNEIIGNKEPLFFADKFLIERKSGDIKTGGGFAEMRNNLVSGHKQFKAEFERMNNVENVILLIENAKSLDDIKKVNSYKMPKSQFIKIFHSFIKNRNDERVKDIQIEFTHISSSGEMVMMLIFNYINNYFNNK